VPNSEEDLIARPICFSGGFSGGSSGGFSGQFSGTFSGCFSWHTLLFLLSLAASPTGAAEIKFRHHFVSRTLPIQMGPTEKNGTGDYGQTALVDLDRDGDLDFVVGGRQPKPERLYWFEFEGPDRWIEHRVGADYKSDVGLAALDVDGDGWMDLVTSGVWYRNPRKPREAEFERRVFDAAAAGAHDIVVHDMDGDRRPDVVLMGDERTQLKGLVWYSIPVDPAAAWEKHAIGPAIHGAIAPAGIADLDGDGDADVLRGDTWFENKDGKGREWIPHPNIPFCRAGPFGKCVRTWVVDIDGDGKEEIVMSDSDIEDSRVVVLKNADGRGGAWTKAELPRSFTYGSLHSLAVADVNGDRRPDILVNEQEELLPAGRSNPRWVVWENLGGGQFAERIVLDQRLGGHELVAGDVDGDGDIDIVSKPWGVRADNGAGGKMHVDFLENLLKR
jgi:VCBS repeat protein